MLAETAAAGENLTATSILIAIAVGFGLYAMLKGLARLLTFLIAVSGAAAAGFFAWQNADRILVEIRSQVFFTIRDWMPYALSGIAAIGAYFAIRSFAKTFFLKPPDHYGNRKFGFGAKAGLVGLILGVGVVTAGMSGIRYADGIEQLEQLRDQLTGKSGEESSFLSKVRAFFDNCQAGRFLQKADPINDPDTLAAAKMLLAHSLTTPPPGSQSFAGGQRSESPIAKYLSGSPEVRELIASGDFAALLDSEVLQEILTDPEVQKNFNNLLPGDLMNGDAGWMVP